MDPTDPYTQVIGRHATTSATANLGALPAEVVLMITVLFDNSKDMISLALVNRHCYRTAIHKGWEHDVKVTGECRSLMRSAELSNIDGMVRAVRDYGADPSVLHRVSGRNQLRYEASALGLAIEHMNPLMVRVLLDLGCNVEKPSQLFSSDRYKGEAPSPLLQLLLNHGTSRLKTHPLGKSQREQEAVHDVSEREIALMDEWCREARQLAGVLCEIVQILVDHGANINVTTTCLLPTSYACCSPLGIAIMSGMPAEVVSLLLSLGASPIPTPRPRLTFYPTTLLFYACIWDSLEHNQSLTEPISTTLLKCKDLHPQEFEYKRIYFHHLVRWVARKGSVSQFGTANPEQETLFARIVDLEVANMADCGQETQPSLWSGLHPPIDKATWLTLLGAWVELVRDRPCMLNVAMTYISILVTQKGVSPNGPCSGLSHHSPLHRICEWNMYPAANRTMLSLLKFFIGLPGIDLEWTDGPDSKQTPLHVACKGSNSREELIVTLLGAGANPLAEDAQGQRPLDLYRESTWLSSQEVLDYIQSCRLMELQRSIPKWWNRGLLSDLLETAMRERQQQ
ncbi:hypothetical protein PspLS_01906 [Pyricularia sp. CBS 133598]|nr:hypothetical protein PspLS_01906 [Pyricularia sp. CBS 133598]